VSRVAQRTGLHPRALVGAAVLLGGTLLWVLAFTGVLSTVFSSSTETIRANFASIEDIVPNDPVRIDGVQVGTVQSESILAGGRGATLTMNIDTSQPIYGDASAAILWRTVLGANDAVALDPGTRAAGLLGSRTIPQSRDSNQVELDQITQAIHDGAQTGIQTTLQQLSPALSDHPALANALSELAHVAPTATVGIGALRGVNQDADLENLVKNAGAAAQAVSVGTGAFMTRRFVESAANTLSALSADTPALQTGIQRLSRLLPLASTNFANLNQDLTVLDSMLPQLTADAPQVAPTLRELHPAVTNLHTLLTDATPLFNKLRPTVDSLATTANVGVPVINTLSPSLERLNNTILPGLAETTPETRGHPAYTLIGPTVVSLGTLASFVNSNGEMANLTLGLGAGNATGGLLPCQLDFSGPDLIVCNTLSQTLGELFTGGTSLLGDLARRPGGAAVYGKELSRAQSLGSALSGTTQALLAKAPAVAKYLLEPNHGAGQ
jgi:ABC-type transporter Mla subunit MlaD